MCTIGCQCPKNENVGNCFRNQGQYAKKIKRGEQAKVCRAIERTNEEVRLLKQVANVWVRKGWNVHPYALLHLTVFHDETGGALYDVLIGSPVQENRKSEKIHTTFGSSTLTRKNRSSSRKQPVVIQWR